MKSATSLAQSLLGEVSGEIEGNSEGEKSDIDQVTDQVEDILSRFSEDTSIKTHFDGSLALYITDEDLADAPTSGQLLFNGPGVSNFYALIEVVL